MVSTLMLRSAIAIRTRRSILANRNRPTRFIGHRHSHCPMSMSAVRGTVFLKDVGHRSLSIRGIIDGFAMSIHFHYPIEIKKPRTRSGVGIPSKPSWLIATWQEFLLLKSKCYSSQSAFSLRLFSNFLFRLIYLLDEISNP